MWDKSTTNVANMQHRNQQLQKAKKTPSNYFINFMIANCDLILGAGIILCLIASFLVLILLIQLNYPS